MNNQKIVGVDTHKDTIACYCDGKFKESKTNTNGFKQAAKWAGKANWVKELIVSVELLLPI